MLQAELTTCSVVVGKFSPTMYHPYWFEKNGIISEYDSEFAIARKDNYQMIVTNPFTVFGTEEIVVQVEENKMQIESIHGVSTLLKEFVTNTFNTLFSNEFSSFGINRIVHYKIESVEMYRKIGDRLAPKQYWKELFGEDENGHERGGLLQIKMEEKKEDGFGRVMVEIAVYVN